MPRSSRRFARGSAPASSRSAPRAATCAARRSLPDSPKAGAPRLSRVARITRKVGPGAAHRRGRDSNPARPRRPHRGFARRGGRHVPRPSADRLPRLPGDLRGRVHRLHRTPPPPLPFSAHARSFVRSFRAPPPRADGRGGAGQVGDARVCPPAQRAHFAERVIAMPHTYQCNSHALLYPELLAPAARPDRCAPPPPSPPPSY